MPRERKRETMRQTERQRETDGETEICIYSFICISIFNILGDHINQFFSTFTNIKIMFVQMLGFFQ